MGRVTTRPPEPNSTRGKPMSLKTITALAIAGLVSLPMAAAVFAQGEGTTPTLAPFTAPATPEEAVEARQALMRTNGATLRSAGTLTGAEAVAAMETLYNDFENLPELFPEGSVVGDSQASPAIWENWDAFVAIAEKGKAAALDGWNAAQAGDAAAYGAAIQAIGATCGECHQQFRAG
jgi:cytochrome c556